MISLTITELQDRFDALGESYVALHIKYQESELRLSSKHSAIAQNISDYIDFKMKFGKEFLHLSDEDKINSIRSKSATTSPTTTPPTSPTPMISTLITNT